MGFVDGIKKVGMVIAAVWLVIVAFTLNMVVYVAAFTTSMLLGTWLALDVVSKQVSPVVGGVFWILWLFTSIAGLWLLPDMYGMMRGKE